MATLKQGAYRLRGIKFHDFSMTFQTAGAIFPRPFFHNILSLHVHSALSVGLPKKSEHSTVCERHASDLYKGERAEQIKAKQFF